MSKRLVVKMGGHALSSSLGSSTSLVDLAADVRQLNAEGWLVTIVHGGGPRIDEVLHSLNVTSTFRDGLRVTSPDALRGVVMALSSLNVDIVSDLCSNGVRAVGLSGTDASTLRATALGEHWGRTGSSPKADPVLVEELWHLGYVPVISPLAVDSNGAVLNCNADAAAGALAGALGAQALVLLSDVDQLRLIPSDETTGIARVSKQELLALFDEGVVQDGMRPKMRAALESVDAGASRVVVGNGQRPHALAGLMKGDLAGTEVVA